MSRVKALAAFEQGQPLQRFEYNLGTLGDDEVDIDVRYCGICHSDLSMIDNEWGMSTYPLVAGHEVIGTISAVGRDVRHVSPGQIVGVGWYARSCRICQDCMSGDHNLCASAEGIVVGRHGGFANKVRVQAMWATPLPAGLDPAKAGPMFCGGATVFNPIIQNGVRPIDRVGVVGIGGLGHLAIRFLVSWGCEVTAFSTSPDKAAEAKAMGAMHFVATHDKAALEGLQRRFDLILDTVNQPIDWDAYIGMLAPRGKLHIVGAVPSVTATIFPMISGQKSIGGSPLGSPATVVDMFEFANRHAIAPITEHFPMSRINEALDRLRAGKARYRIVLEKDLD